MIHIELIVNRYYDIIERIIKNLTLHSGISYLNIYICKKHDIYRNITIYDETIIDIENQFKITDNLSRTNLDIDKYIEAVDDGKYNIDFSRFKIIAINHLYRNYLNIRDIKIEINLIYEGHLGDFSEILNSEKNNILNNYLNNYFTKKILFGMSEEVYIYCYYDTLYDITINTLFSNIFIH